MKRFIVSLSALVLVLSVPSLCRADTLEEVLEKNAKAIGGREVLDNLKDVTKEGTIRFISHVQGARPQEGRFRSSYKSPDKAYMLVGMGPQLQVQCTNGRVYWVSDSTRPLQGAMMADATRTQQRVEDARMDNTYMANYPKIGVKLEYLGVEKVGDRDAHVIKVTRPHGQEFRSYLDKETGLVVKEQRSDSEISYYDWRKVDGLVYPFLYRIVNAANTVEIKLDSVKINTGVTDELFEAPRVEIAPQR